MYKKRHATRVKDVRCNVRARGDLALVLRFKMPVRVSAEERTNKCDYSVDSASAISCLRRREEWGMRHSVEELRQAQVKRAKCGAGAVRFRPSVGGLEFGATEVCDAARVGGQKATQTPQPQDGGVQRARWDGGADPAVQEYGSATMRDTRIVGSIWRWVASIWRDKRGGSEYSGQQREHFAAAARDQLSLAQSGE
ncbi:hypothetical protein FB451DRAFT_1179094 [Mycena latifolia]|nr:hypothetical protein FB451DRAFT_1179094 [Mycena latifolia]